MGSVKIGLPSKGLWRWLSRQRWKRSALLRSYILDDSAGKLRGERALADGGCATIDLAKLMPVLTVGGNQETTVPCTVAFGPAEHQSISDVDTAREALQIVNDLEARGALIAYILTPGGGEISKANLHQMAEWETAHHTKRR